MSMHERAVKIFSLFMLVAITATLFIFFYRQITNRRVNAYIAEITTCGNITSEADCYARDFCEGIYGPASADSQGQVFLRCEKISDQTAAVLQQQRARCEATSGQWYRNRLGSSCLCQSA